MAFVFRILRRKRPIDDKNIPESGRMGSAAIWDDFNVPVVGDLGDYVSGDY